MMITQMEGAKVSPHDHFRNKRSFKALALHVARGIAHRRHNEHTIMSADVLDVQSSHFSRLLVAAKSQKKNQLLR